MLLLGPKTSCLYWRSTGTLPTAMLQSIRNKLMSEHALFALPRQVPDQQRFFEEYRPFLDKTTLADLRQLQLIHQELDTVVFSSVERNRGRRLRCCQVHMTLPPKSILCITPDIFVCAPWLCVLKLAHDRKNISSVHVLFSAAELCSRYAYDCRPSCSDKLVERTPITSVKNIRESLESLVKINSKAPHGISRLRAILPYVLDNARSPMEIASYILASWSNKHGGCGFKLPSLNRRIELSPNERRITNKGFLEADLIWKDAMLICEYDGIDHDGQMRRQQDALRNTILENKGYQIEKLTSSIIKDIDSFDMVMQKIADRLNMKMPDDADFMLRHRMLHSAVLQEAKS